MAVLAQVPAGVPYDPATHPNPIVTWVRNQDFKPATFAQAEQLSGVELMGLSQDEGRRELMEIASPAQSLRRVQILNNNIEVTFYAVARQTYRLKSGHTFVMCSFRFPRAPTSAEALNDAAFTPPRRPADARFGPLNAPDKIDIRDVPGLLFDNGKERTIYWFEMGAGHTVTTDAAKEELFRVLEDLL
jgi:hypothetical protein